MPAADDQRGLGAIYRKQRWSEAWSGLTWSSSNFGAGSLYSAAPAMIVRLNCSQLGTACADICDRR
jgi:hypothetical protein